MKKTILCFSILSILIVPAFAEDYPNEIQALKIKINELTKRVSEQEARIERLERILSDSKKVYDFNTGNKKGSRTKIVQEETATGWKSLQIGTNL